MHVQERRGARRYPSSLKGYVIVNGIDLDLRTHDISLTGALVEFSSLCSIRTGLKLRVHLDIGYIGTAVVCRSVADNDRALFAIAFEEPLPETVTIH